jgi:cyclopropane fatty-acyl-phospholipid synthase-like methyltransferase
VPSSREVAYWEEVADKSVGNGNYFDNVWKRPMQLQRLLKYEFYGRRVLEIGTGNGKVAGTISMLLGNNWNYVGTELSGTFRDFARDVHGLRTIAADVKELPDGKFERIIAFDSLEHVRPEDRPAGYARMATVAAPGCLLFIHYSNGVSHHDKEFDHPFGLADIVEIERAGFRLKSFEEYDCHHEKIGAIPYVFVVMERNGSDA